ncbi:MAG: adenylate/guanylate cyclase domain-containing protein [Rhodospirillaceae bacterium]|jgi:class 3 adenylate cyclase|nr:adenylate/guanylate cyclase domain-containing protein [Rhodospirillaceae bacterium]
MGILGMPSGIPENDDGDFNSYQSRVATTHRSGVDLLLMAQAALIGPRFDPAQSRVAVVVIDEETYATEPFRDTPKVAWTPMLAQLIERLDRAGTTVIGLDQIYPTSLDRKTLLPGFDKPMLKAFYKVGRSGRLVLGETRLSEQVIRPYPGQVMAVGGTGNIAPLNLLLDGDEIVRRQALRFPNVSGGSQLSFAAALADRAGFDLPAGDFMINFNTGAHDIPRFSLADINACTGAKAEAFFKRHFANRVVLIGSALDVEDRHRTAKRFANAYDPSYQPARCALPYEIEKYGETIVRRSMPGVFIHAAAINTMARNDALQLTGGLANFALITAVATLISIIFFSLPPLAGVFAGFAGLAVEAAAALFAFEAGIILPLVAMLLSSLACFAIVYAYRFTLEDRTKRRIHNAFRHYLAPTLVDQLAERADSLVLGGEVRRVTVWFSDIVGYTSISEALTEEPEKLVEVVNRYFTTLCAVVEKHGGYVDKFIGDAALCVWGAPLEDEQAERRALLAALECLDALEVFNRDVMIGEYGLPPIGTRIGINSGAAVVGNMGSTTRFNYTVTGDTVNLASRLEGANKVYGSLVMLGEETVKGAGNGFIVRRLDRLIVKGKQQPVTAYELIGQEGRLDEKKIEAISAFEAALDLYYGRDFAAALTVFAGLAEGDPVAALYQERCSRFVDTPPEEDWDGSYTMTSK